MNCTVSRSFKQAVNSRIAAPKTRGQRQVWIQVVRCVCAPYARDRGTTTPVVALPSVLARCVLEQG